MAILFYYEEMDETILHFTNCLHLNIVFYLYFYYNVGDSVG